MKRIFFVHWNAAEAEERAGRLRHAGYGVEAYWRTDNTRLGHLRANPPDLILVDLSRVPSAGASRASVPTAPVVPPFNTAGSGTPLAKKLRLPLWRYSTPRPHSPQICAVDETWSGLCFARRRVAGSH